MKTYEYELQGDGRDSWKCTDTVTGEVYMVYERPLNWRGLTEGLYASNIFMLVLMGQVSVSSIAYSTLIKMLTDGEAGNCSQEKLLSILQVLSGSFSQEQKDEINTILTNNLFTIQL